jgi:Tyrosyl-DNA phosphodiesterase
MNYCHPTETRQKFGQCQIRHILQNEPEPAAFQRPMRARNSTSSSSSSSGNSGKTNSSSATTTGNSNSSSSSKSSSKKTPTPAQYYAKDLSMASALSSVWTYNRDLCGNLTGPAVPDEPAEHSTTAISGSSSSSSASGRAAAARTAAVAAGTSSSIAMPTKGSTTTTATSAESVYTGSNLLCQCSSLALLSAEWLNTFYDNFTAKAGTSSGATASTSESTDALDMQIVWPTAASIRDSLSGWQAGDSIFCQPSNMFEVRTACYTHAS